MVLDHAGISPNAARDRVQVKLPREEPDEIEPPTADHVEAVGWLLTPTYLLALVVLDSTGVRVGELEAAKLGDLDETRRARQGGRQQDETRTMGRTISRRLGDAPRASPGARGP
jgi:integrase